MAMIEQNHFVNDSGVASCGSSPITNPAMALSGPALTNLDSGNDFQKEAVGPAATATFHGDTVAAGMLLQE